MTYEINMINEVHGGEAYLITSGDDAVLIDTGYAVGVDGTIKNIEKHLDGRKLEYIIFTHSHYDHVMGAPAICEHFKDVKIYAHPRVRQIFTKGNARKTMEDMNEAAAKDRGIPAIRGWSDKLHVDVDVSEGDVIQAGNMKIRVIETPGHTNCSISLYFENEDLLVAAETIGVPLDFPNVVPTFIVSYEDTVKSIEKVKALNPESILLPHSKKISGDDVAVYFNNAFDIATEVHDTVINLYNEGLDVDAIVAKLKAKYFVGNFREYQPEEAFDANWIPMTRRIIQKLGPQK